MTRKSAGDGMDTFWPRIQFTKGCWLWTGGKTNGYGVFRHLGKIKQAHRVSFEFFVGPIPEGLQIDHLCRTPACVRPEHLEAVTQKENILRGDAPSAKAARRSTCIKGHAYTKENTRPVVNDKGTLVQRRCRQCHREAEMRYRKAKK